jgi:hypothetical protein
MATTTNYGWDTPDDTDLVKDGAAAIRTLGSSVDTTTKALNPSTTLGDIEYRSATGNTNTLLPIGTTGQVLAVVGGVPAWATTADQTPLTTKGDLFTFDTADARLGIGANNTVLTADSAEATGMKWATPAAGGMTLIASGTLSGANVDLTSIPATYNDLRLVLANYYQSTSGNVQITFNNVSGGNDYWQAGFAHNGSSYTTAYSGQGGYLWLCQDQTNYSAANQRSISVLEIKNYASTIAHKPTNNTYGLQTGASTYVQGFDTGVWKSASAIDRITIEAEGARTWSGGNYYLYGVK